MKLLLLCLVLLTVAGLTYIRLAASPPERWHVDPVLAGDPGPGGIRVEPGRMVSPLPPRDLLAAFDRAALAEPRAQRLAGRLVDGRITYVFRSRVFGFPDYLTVQALPHAEGSTLAALSRLRFGRSDFDVNEARLERLLDRMGPEIVTGR